MARKKTVDADQAEFGRRVKAARDALALTQESLSLASGIPQNTISQIEHGNVNLSFESIWRLARALRVTMAELMPDFEE